MKFVSIPEELASKRTASLEELYTDERWLALGDLIPDGLLIIDPAGIVRYMNSAAESINEVYRVMVVGHSLDELIQQSRIDLSILPEAFTHGARINKTVQDTDGHGYLLSTRGYWRWSGESSAFMVVLRNLTILAKNIKTEQEAAIVFTLPGATAKAGAQSDNEPIISGEATSKIVTRGLRAIAMNVNVLILGESGVGKTELARLLHRRSGSPTRPFVHVNCGSIPDSLFESEMFGYERGAFTGASSRGKKGLIEAADGGVLFLDEIGEIPLHCQAKILQILEEGIIQRVGATVSRQLRLQIIAATNRDLYTLVEEGRFRRDLYYRLCVVTLDLPPLRARPELLAPLIERFLEKVNQRRSVPLAIDAGCRRRLLACSWPGNVRELQNIIEYLGVSCDRTATEADLPLRAEEFSMPVPAGTVSPAEIMPLPVTSEVNLREAVRNYESAMIEAAIQKTGSKRKAAELLGVDIATVVRKSRTQPVA